MTLNTLKPNGVDEDDATKYCNAIMGKGDTGTFVDLYGRGSLVADANRPQRRLGLKGLGAFHLRTLRPGGGNGDFKKGGYRKLDKKMVRDMNPDFVIGAPTCTSWCVWIQHMKNPKMDPERVKALMAKGRTQLDVVARL